MARRTLKSELKADIHDIRHPHLRQQVHLSVDEFKGRFHNYQKRGGVVHSVGQNVVHPIHATKDRRERKAARETHMQGRLLRRNRRGGPTQKHPGLWYTAQQKHPVAYETAKHSYRYAKQGATVGAVASTVGGGGLRGDLFKMSTLDHADKSFVQRGVAGAATGAVIGAGVGAVRGRYGKTTKRIRRNEGWSRRKKGDFSKHSKVGYTYNLKGQYHKRGGK